MKPRNGPEEGAQVPGGDPGWWSYLTPTFANVTLSFALRGWRHATPHVQRWLEGALAVSAAWPEVIGYLYFQSVIKTEA